MWQNQECGCLGHMILIKICIWHFCLTYSMSLIVRKVENEFQQKMAICTKNNETEKWSSAHFSRFSVFKKYIMHIDYMSFILLKHCA